MGPKDFSGWAEVEVDGLGTLGPTRAENTQNGACFTSSTDVDKIFIEHHITAVTIAEPPLTTRVERVPNNLTCFLLWLSKWILEIDSNHNDFCEFGQPVA